MNFPRAAAQEIDEIRSVIDDLGTNMAALTGNLNEFFEAFLRESLIGRGYTSAEAIQLIEHRSNPKIAERIRDALH